MESSSVVVLARCAPAGSRDVTILPSAPAIGRLKGARRSRVWQPGWLKYDLVCDGSTKFIAGLVSSAAVRVRGTSDLTRLASIETVLRFPYGTHQCRNCNRLTRLRGGVRCRAILRLRGRSGGRGRREPIARS